MTQLRGFAVVVVVEEELACFSASGAAESLAASAGRGGSS